MKTAFMLFMMICNASGKDCQPQNGGYYVTQAACQRAYVEKRAEMTDGQCKRMWVDPN